MRGISPTRRGGASPFVGTDFPRRIGPACLPALTYQWGAPALAEQ